jgi:hypothetical protein
LNLKSANGSNLDTFGAVVFAAAIIVAAVAIKVMLEVGLAALFLPLPDIFAYRVSPLIL